MTSRWRIGKPPGERTILRLLLITGLVNGLLYVFLVPPWQHYDEPGHFEYAWLLANWPTWPQPGDYDQSMRREVNASMVEHGFFRGLEPISNLVAQTEPVWIGISQLDDPPLFYFLISLPLKLVQTTDVAFQLQVGRLVSLLLYLASIWAAFGVTAECTPLRHPLRWMVPAFMVLSPGYTDMMTAVNNDVGAAATFSLFLWVGVRVLVRGFTLWRGILLAALGFLCWNMKSTAALALPLAVLICLFSVLRAEKHRFAWAAVFVGILGMGLVFLAPLGAAGWYRVSVRDDALQRRCQTGMPFGDCAIEAKPPPSGASRSRLIQFIPQDDLQALRKKTVTLGAWIWADEPVTAKSLILDDGNELQFEEVDLGTEPRFYAMRARVSETAALLRIVIESLPRNKDEPITLYLDGLVLVEGDFTTLTAPEFQDGSATHGEWQGTEFNNLVRNASFEIGGLQIAPSLEQALYNLLPYRLSHVLTSLGDLQGVGWYYRGALETLLQTFWARFGWGHVSLSAGWIYWLFAGVTLSGVIGGIVASWRRRNKMNWTLLALLGCTIAAVWFAALVRGVDLFDQHIFFPSARYTYPAMIPTSLLLVSGWWEITHHTRRFVQFSLKAQILIYLVGLFSLNLLGLWTIFRFYSAG